MTKVLNLMFASHGHTCGDGLCDLSLVTGLVRRELFGRGPGRRCEVGCQLHVNFEARNKGPRSSVSSVCQV